MSDSLRNRMIDGGFQALVVATALGCGLISGTFFSFSTFAIEGLRRLPARDGNAAMQAINLEAVTPWFMTAFMGTTLACLGSAIWAMIDWADPASLYVLLGAGLYLLGVFIMTAVYHVPRNNRLAATDPDSEDGAAYWETYQQEWARWNHVRTVTALLAAAAFTTALVV